jgi:hypothetical protein
MTLCSFFDTKATVLVNEMSENSAICVRNQSLFLKFTANSVV